MIRLCSRSCLSALIAPVSLVAVSWVAVFWVAVFWVAVFLVAASSSAAEPQRGGEEVEIQGRKYRLPPGYEMHLVAGPPLVDRPICADFDEQGRLYVANSSGTNDNVKTQLEEKPHQIFRLEDTNGDGRFDKRIVFARDMMFPEGALWHDGSLYVAAPPSIWKLTDTDGDGHADQRQEWFKGLTLTGCANDLHGPYLGPDGWIYWCKGAFAEQTHKQDQGDPLVTKAAHIFRRRPEGGNVESVMAGGMDNPVEVVFTPGGERIFTTTFLVHPGGGKRDGLIHAIYGGLYGKEHSVLNGHVRTGPTMPILSHLGAAAPCGLARLRTADADKRTAVLACSFNMHRITRHRLEPRGGTFESHLDEFVASDDLDFHPTDVLEDADGSVLVVDTGGWYKLCCPTSQLWKPDVLGGIYRVRRKADQPIADPRGNAIAWSSQTERQLAELLSDTRFAVRERAQAALASRGEKAVPALQAALKSERAQTRLLTVWTLCRIDSAVARRAIRTALSDTDATVRQAAAHAASVWRDRESAPALRKLLASDSAHNRRAAAEALGRLGDPSAIPDLLTAAADYRDRTLEHSLAYALIELGDVQRTRRGLASDQPYTHRAALLAIDAIQGGGLDAKSLVPLFDSKHPPLQETAWFLADRHREWSAQYAPYFRARLAKGEYSAEELVELSDRLLDFASAVEVQHVIADALKENAAAAETQRALLKAVVRSSLRSMPESWVAPLSRLLASKNGPLMGDAVAAAHKLAAGKPHSDLVVGLRAIANNPAAAGVLRLRALAALPKRSSLDAGAFRFLLSNLTNEDSVQARALAVDVLLAAKLTGDQRSELASATTNVGPLELNRLLAAFENQNDPALGGRLVQALLACPSAAALQPQLLKQRLSPFGNAVLSQAEPLFDRIKAENQEKFERMESVLSLLDQADPRRGQRIFQSAKVSCSACHAMGYLGGRVGPDLTRIGNIRSERDLLESVLFPSSSFVRSYEPTKIVTRDGRIINGVVKDETAGELIVQIDAQKVEHVRLSDIEERRPGELSIMPTGLEKQLTPQSLADLIRFMKEAR